MAEPGREGHSGPALCPRPNSLTQTRCLRLTFSICGFPSPAKAAGDHPVLSDLLPFKHAVSYSSSAPLCVLFIYLFILLCNFIIHFLS